jgi:hypothetical protein
MAHTSTKRWVEVEAKITQYAHMTIDTLNQAEEAYQQFQEVYVYAGSTDQGLADLLFQDTNGYDSAGDPNPATAEQVAMATDAKNAMVALHQIYQATNNEAVTQDDRFTKLRRMV